MGALSGALARLQANRPLRELREIAKGVTKQLPEPIQVNPACYFAHRAEHYSSPNNIWSYFTFRASPRGHTHGHCLAGGHS